MLGRAGWRRSADGGEHEGAVASACPYELHWSDDPTAGVLYDPRTKARVPLSPAELEVLQMVLAGRVLGRRGVRADEAVVGSPAFANLRARLGI